VQCRSPSKTINFPSLKLWPNGIASQLASTCDSVWPGLACTCVDLRWLALILVEIKFARKRTQVFYHLATQPKSTQVEWCSLTYYQPMKYRMSALKCFFFFCEETYKSVWPPNATFSASSTCGYFRLLASPFDQGFSPRKCNKLLVSVIMFVKDDKQANNPRDKFYMYDRESIIM